MRIYFNQDKDGHKAGKSYFVERSLARRFCDSGIAIPLQTHLDNIYAAEQAAKVKPEPVEVPEVPEVPEEEPEVEKPAITPKRNTKRR